ncbi:preprotein translocase subunit SecE [Neptunicella marina]|uniref:Protein translocase subunit SecE n=1 Tax=Neptunicella marina TaxID=2125989 RepID=A0A8J6IXV1_9ALTE|nr:preprotein translocase subunit SecE [Neptunicella marina]MBC3767869.1 preprotein translocase subunit SecE [Neptunicella marina]
MSANTENASTPVDLLKWFIVIGLLVLAIAGNHIYEETSVLVRALGVVVSVIVALLIASTTVKGSQFVSFAKESRTEVRKVVWPTRQETTQTTIIVMVAVVIMSLLLWMLDGIIVRVVSFITGLGI